MFAKRPPPSPAAPIAVGGFTLPLGPFANPVVGVAAAGGLLVMAVVGLIQATGDPGAGAPRVKISLSQALSVRQQAALPATADVDALAQAGAASDTVTLAPAPIAGLYAPGPGGLLPIIGPDGRTPAQAYARPFRDTGIPKVALVIGGLGLNAKVTREAIEKLPPEVTLSFVPYAEGLQGWIDLARAHGHEALLEAPMEPADYPQNDPGPYTLMAKDPPAETTKRLEQLLSRATGYFGVTNYLGGRFLASDSAMSTFSTALRRRGLAFVDDGSAVGRASGPPRASADRVIDQTLNDQSISQELEALEDFASQRGEALASGFAYPVTLEAVQNWAAGLSARGLALAPASALTAQGGR
jgi:hypothetical protein